MSRCTYPLMLDVSDRPVVIVGGGAVAVRKARLLLQAGATRIRCVAPRVDPRMPPEIKVIRARFQPQHLSGAALVFAATDQPEVNNAVVREAHRRGALVNRADADASLPGDFSVPAVHRAGAVTLAVSAGGSAALAAEIRDHLARHLRRSHVRLAALLQKIRPLLRDAADLPPSRRREAIRQLARLGTRQALGKGAMQQLCKWLARRFPELRDLFSRHGSAASATPHRTGQFGKQHRGKSARRCRLTGR